MIENREGEVSRKKRSLFIKILIAIGIIIPLIVCLPLAILESDRKARTSIFTLIIVKNI